MSLALPRRALGVLALFVFAGLVLLLGACGGSESDDGYVLDAETPVIFIVIDTLRADHLSCYGYPLETSPLLDELASRSFLFESNSTQCNATFPSLTSIFTGVYPKTHRNYLAVPIEGTAVGSGGLRCAAEAFRDVGYYAAAATSHPSWGARRDRDATLWKGWNEISHLGDPIPIEDRPLFARAENTNERLFGLLDEYDRGHGEKPLFLWAHYFDPHTDLYGNLYDPPLEHANRYFDHHFDALGLSDFKELLRPLDPETRNEWIHKNAPKELRFRLKLAAGRAGYDAEIYSCDQQLQDLFDRLDESGAFDKAVLVIMSDHGENMDEHLEDRDAHPFTHKRLYDGVSHTPMLIHLPGQTEGRRISSITQNIDALPTVMELLGLPMLDQIEGKSLVPLMFGLADEVHESVFMESSQGREKAVRTDDLKLIDGWVPDEQEVYDWRGDPEELHNLVEQAQENAPVDLSQALEDFRPEVKLRIRCVPMKNPYGLEIQAQMPGVRFEEVEGVPASAISEDGSTFTWSGQIGPEGKEISLSPRTYRAAQEVHWRVRHSGRNDLPKAVRLGKTPVSHTPAIPLWNTRRDLVPENPAYTIVEDSNAGVARVELLHPGARHFEVEVRYAAPRFDKHFEVLRSEGFSERFPPNLQHHRSDAYGVESALLELQVSHAKALRYFLLRIDGNWPDPKLLSINGEGVDENLLHFMFPTLPMDKRIQPYMSAGPTEQTNLPPGSIVIWQESGGDGGEIDASHLSKELADQLNSIGYLGDDEPEGEE